VAAERKIAELRAQEAAVSVTARTVGREAQREIQVLNLPPVRQLTAQEASEPAAEAQTASQKPSQRSWKRSK
jgi:hypothetical protein